MIKPVLLVRLIKRRLAAREAILTQEDPELEHELGVYGDLARAEVRGHHIAIQEEIAFLKALIHECENPMPGAAR